MNQILKRINSKSGLKFPDNSAMRMTGERYVPGFRGFIKLEHQHRYLYAAKYCGEKRVLDVACGEGYGSFLLSQIAAHVIGVDLDGDSIEHASKTYTNSKLHYRQAAAHDLSFIADHSIDVVVSFETIEHITEQKAFVKEVKRVLREDGIFVVSTPDKQPYNDTLTEPNQFHLRELSRSELEVLLLEHFANVAIRSQTSLYGSLLLDQGSSSPAIQSFVSEDSSTYDESDSLSAPFLVALASDNLVEAPGLSVLSSNNDVEDLSGKLGYAEQRMWQLESQIPRLESRCFTLESEINHLKQRLDQLQLYADLARAESAYLRERIRPHSDD